MCDFISVTAVVESVTSTATRRNIADPRGILREVRRLRTRKGTVQVRGTVLRHLQTLREGRRRDGGELPGASTRREEGADQHELWDLGPYVLDSYT